MALEDGLDMGGELGSPFFTGIISSDQDLMSLPTTMPEPEKRAPSEEAEDHNANLAEHMDEGELEAISEDLLSKFQRDIESRSNWERTVREGLKLFGVIDDIGYKGPFPKATKLVFPTLSIAAYQFQARAIAEMFPSKGPVKGMVLGRITPEKEAQAKRVEGYMNYQLTIEDPGYYPDLEQMLLYLCLYGSTFKKVYRDVLTGKNISRYIKAEDLVVPYNASSLAEAQRFTHVMRISRDDVKKMQVAGVYRDVELDDPSTSESDDPNHAIQELYAEAENRDENIAEDEARDIVLESYAYLDLAGYEDEHKGKPTGIALPYVVSIDKVSKKVLAIRRGWNENDPLKARQADIVHYYYLPGLGFYGYGLIQLVGSIAKAQTGVLRCLLNAGTLASLQGGFKTRDSKLTGEQLVVEPGAYKDVDATYDDLNRAFWTPKFGEPSAVLFNLLGTLTEQAQRFTSTTEAMVGDAATTGPVGTTVAQIEQGSKVYSAIHKRLHQASAQEFRMLSKLNYEYMPADGYPYEVYGEDREIAKADFDDRVDVIPVSDPNFFSAAQRLATAQAQLQLAEKFPQIYDLREANKRMLDALDVRDPEELLPEPEEAGRHDPITEGALMMAGKPVRAYLEQDHQAHIQLHMNMLQTMAATNPQGAQMLEPVVIAHLREHYAYQYYLQAQQQTGIPLPPLNIFAKKGEPVSPEIPPEMENQIAQQMAMTMPPPPPTPEQQQQNQEAQAAQALAQAELQIEQQKAAQAEQIAQEKFMRDEQRKQAAFDAEQRRQMLRTATEINRQDRTTDVKIAIDKRAADAELAANERMNDAEIEESKKSAEAQRKLDAKKAKEKPAPKKDPNGGA